MDSIPVDTSSAVARAMQLQRSGDVKSAEATFRQILRDRPEDSQATHFLGLLLYQTARVDDGIALLERSVQLMPGVAKFRLNLATALHAVGRIAPAIEQVRKAIELESSNALAHYNLGVMLRDIEDYDGAIESIHRAIALNPSFAPAHEVLGLTLTTLGRAHDGFDSLKTAAQLAPDDARAASNRLLAMHYLPELTAREVFEAHADWGRKWGQPARRAEPHRNDRSPDRVLRLGYLSPDFRSHSVAWLFESILLAHDRSQVRVIAYNNSAKFNAVSARLKSEFDEWRDVVGLSDDSAEKLIREDQIDVLIDLAGHTAGGRLTLLARQPAPVQFTYIGYPATTGVPAIQYRITDAVVDPAGAEALHTESLVRVPDCFLCYRPDPTAPPTQSHAPAADRGFVTFGSFNNFAKINEPLLEWWAKILNGVPRSRLIIKARGVTAPSASARIAEFFSRRGISADRLDLLGWTEQSEQHRAMTAADIALDTFPYTGTVTTFETLWLGVPTITLAGATHVSRVSSTILSTLGCAELIAANPVEYVTKAIALASDSARLDEYRRMLRDRMKASPLLDGARLARSLEQQYRAAWRKWAANES